VIQVESGFDRFAISSVGAQGLMQVMPFWKNEIGRPGDNLTKVDTNLRYGTTILSYYLEKEDGDVSGVGTLQRGVRARPGIRSVFSMPLSGIFG